MNLSIIKHSRCIDVEFIRFFDMEFYYVKNTHGEYYYNLYNQIVISVQQRRIQVAINPTYYSGTEFDVETLTSMFNKYTKYKNNYTIIPMYNFIFSSIIKNYTFKNPILKKYRNN